MIAEKDGVRRINYDLGVKDNVGAWDGEDDMRIVYESDEDSYGEDDMDDVDGGGSLGGSVGSEGMDSIWGKRMRTDLSVATEKVRASGAKRRSEATTAHLGLP